MKTHIDNNTISLGHSEFSFCWDKAAFELAKIIKKLIIDLSDTLSRSFDDLFKATSYLSRDGLDRFQKVTEEVVVEALTSGKLVFDKWLDSIQTSKCK